MSTLLATTSRRIGRRLIRGELRDYDVDPTALVRTGSWLLQRDRDGSRWFRAARAGDVQVGEEEIQPPIRKAMLAVADDLWRRR